MTSMTIYCILFVYFPPFFTVHITLHVVISCKIHYNSYMIKQILLFSLVILSICYTNPVQGTRDSPDPGVIYHNGAYYAVTTMGWDGHYFPIWKSTTGTNFSHVGWVLPSAASWTTCCDNWAPELHIINKKFIVYFTARDKSGRLSIGAAISDDILGPYADKGAPLVTNAS